MPSPALRFLLSTLLLLPAWTTLTGQTRPIDVKFRLAESYERSGDLETAVKMLQDIASKDSLNPMVNESLRRDLVQLKRYDDALDVLRRMLRHSPDDIALMAEAGTVYVLKSDRAHASEIWDRAIAVDPNHEATYRIVGGAMVQNRLFDQAIGIYTRARKVLNDPGLFTVDIGYLYGITLNYPAATQEFLTLLKQSPVQMAFVQSRIALYTAQTDALAATTGVVEKAVSQEPGILAFRQLLAWLYLEAKQFDKAYGVYQYIDQATKAAGHEMLRFADRAAGEHAYDAAARAYQDILKQYPQFDRAPEVKFGYARTLENSASAGTDTLRVFGARSPFAARPDTAASGLMLRSIRAYERVIADHPGTETAARSLLRIGIIRQESYADLDGAKSDFQLLEQRYTRFPAIVSEGRFHLGDLTIGLGDLATAAKEFRELADAGPASNDLQSRAVLRLAELDYFNAHFDDALAKLKTLEANPASDVTNDALSLQIIIQSNRKPNDSALTRYAAAELLRRQNHLSEAVTLFESIPGSFPGHDIIDETLTAIGDTYAAMDKYPQAIAAYDRLTTDYPESIEGDRTLMKKGEVYQFGLRDRAKATELYEQLLTKYPNSIYTGEARKQIRILRGETI